MPSIRIPKDLNQAMYFLTFRVKRWYYLFDRYDRWEILLNSLKYCQENKGLRIHAWVFMLNHMHLIAQSDDIAGFVRDFKKFTSKELRRNIEQTEPNILKLFEEDGEYHFWAPDNMPEIVETEKFYLQKVNYIENNPVVKQYVNRPEDWVYSSANEEKLLKLEEEE